MTDILGRKLKAGDVVVCMAIGRYSSGMHLGIQTETDVVLTKSGKKNPYNRYLIENPTEAEKTYVQEILKQEEDRLAEKKREKEIRRAMKAIPRKELKVGYKYEDDRGNKWIYMGWCKVYLQTERPIKKEKSFFRSGYLYFDEWDIRDLEQSLYPFDNLSDANIFKTPKRLVKEIEATPYAEGGNSIDWHFSNSNRYRYWDDLFIVIERGQP